jgi:mannose-1-phosphate guanylyltransferase
MKTENNRRWGLVLAGGEGRRLHALTTDNSGAAVPKQFCSLHGGNTLVQDAIARVRRCVDSDAILTVVSRAHRRHWSRDLADQPDANVIEQPSLRGTAAGILLPLLALADRDPRARLLVMPSDHHVEELDTFAEETELAMQCVEDDDEHTVLLGISPDSADTEYGWIVPEEIDAQGRLQVRSFVEKPPLGRAITLRHRGALWNSFVMATSVPALLGMFRARLPELLERVVAARAEGPAALERAWAELPSHDFSAEVLAGSEDRLWLHPVPPCGWTDLGTPARVASVVRDTPTRDTERTPGPLVLASRCSLPRSAGVSSRM